MAAYVRQFSLLGTPAEGGNPHVPPSAAHVEEEVVRDAVTVTVEMTCDVVVRRRRAEVAPVLLVLPKERMPLAPTMSTGFASLRSKLRATAAAVDALSRKSKEM